MNFFPNDIVRRTRFIFADAAISFKINNDPAMASSLAFAAMLALIPALFLLTFLLGAVIGSSGVAIRRTEELMTQLIPAYSQEILQEVNSIARHKGTIGLVNLLVLFWSTTPLVAAFRVSLGTIFRKKPTRPFLLEKVFDAAISMVFLLGFAVVAVSGIVFTLAERITPFRLPHACLQETAFFGIMTSVVLALYFTFSKKNRLRNLIAGALVTSILWFSLRPAFHAFLTFNPGYGFAFGSFKSIFVVIIWIYISFVLFLFGAEVAACLGRDEAVYIKHLMEGRTDIPARVAGRHVVRHQSGSIIFRDGDRGDEMFSVLKGKVSIRAEGKEVAVIPQGKSFGGLSFFLSSPRSATAVAMEDVELVILNNENINSLMSEFPECIVKMLREMALRLRETGRITD